MTTDNGQLKAEGGVDGAAARSHGTLKVPQGPAQKESLAAGELVDGERKQVCAHIEAARKDDLPTCSV